MKRPAGAARLLSRKSYLKWELTGYPLNIVIVMKVFLGHQSVLWKYSTQVSFQQGLLKVMIHQKNFNKQPTLLSSFLIFRSLKVFFFCCGFCFQLKCFYKGKLCRVFLKTLYWFIKKNPSQSSPMADWKRVLYLSADLPFTCIFLFCCGQDDSGPQAFGSECVANSW